MPNFLIALAIVVIGLWIIRKFARMSPQSSRSLVEKLAGGGIIAFSGLLAIRGQMNVAVPVFLFGLGLMGKGAAFPNGFGWPGRKSAGQKSRVATSQLSMELDHDSGTMDGEVLAGPAKGRQLSSLTDDELRLLHARCGKASDQSQSLLEAWLDRHKGEWRAAWGTGREAASKSGPMSREEALAVLGLKGSPTEAEIRTAHRNLMKNIHPDMGGSDYLAAKVNAAKDVLLGG